MALTFGSTNDDADFGAAASIDDLTAFTWLMWIFPTTLTNLRRIMVKGPVEEKQFIIRTNDVAEMHVARATTAAFATSNNNSMVVNTHEFYAITYDESDGPRIFRGTLSTEAVELGYSSRVVGADGTTADATGNLVIGNAHSTKTVPFQGDISVGAVYAKRMILAEIVRYQWRILSDTDCKLLCHLGFAGTGTQPDWSGNGNSGTVTGATVSDHVPLGPPFGFDLNWQGATAAEDLSHVAALADSFDSVVQRRPIKVTNY